MKVFEQYIKKFNMNKNHIKCAYFHCIKSMDLCKNIASVLGIFDAEEIIVCELIGLFHDISLFEIKDKNNATLLHWSAFSNYNFGVQFLIKNFRNDKENIKFLNYINFKDNNNMTALQYALMNNSHKAILELTLLDKIDLSSQIDKINSQYEFFKELIWVQRGLLSVNWSNASKDAKEWIKGIPAILPAEEDFTL